jgi:hypothetical protein
VTAGRALARLAIASLLVGAGACRRKAPEVTPLPEPFARFELSASAGAKGAGASGDAGHPARAGAPAHPDASRLRRAGADLRAGRAPRAAVPHVQRLRPPAVRAPLRRRPRREGKIISGEGPGYGARWRTRVAPATAVPS